MNSELDAVLRANLKRSAVIQITHAPWCLADPCICTPMIEDVSPPAPLLPHHGERCQLTDHLAVISFKDQPDIVCVEVRDGGPPLPFKLEGYVVEPGRVHVRVFRQHAREFAAALERWRVA